MPIAYGIFSGGLDSLLAALLLMDQKIDVRLLTFFTPFFSEKRALESARSIGLEAMVVDLTLDHLTMMQGPKHGFGRLMNPCIDCHALMFRRAGEIMAAAGADFLFSGEVLGQRPKSQNRRALDIVAKESGFAQYILRPLSAQVLPPTDMEKNGLVDRAGLKGFTGRTRKPQMELAEHFGLKNYPTPAGGCLLTDPVYSRRLKELYEINVKLDPHELGFLTTGRHFRLPGGSKLVVGRNQAENQILERIRDARDPYIKTIDHPGPVVVMVRPVWKDESDRQGDLRLAAEITLAYSDASEGDSKRVRLEIDGREDQLSATVALKSLFSYLMV